MEDLLSTALDAKPRESRNQLMEYMLASEYDIDDSMGEHFQLQIQIYYEAPFLGI